MVFELALSLLIAILLSVLLVSVVVPADSDRRGPGPTLFLFVVLLLATWAGGVWLPPLGPAAWGVHWLSFVVVGLFVALLLAATMPPRYTRAPEGGGLRSVTRRWRSGRRSAPSSGCSPFCWSPPS